MRKTISRTAFISLFLFIVGLSATLFAPGLTADPAIVPNNPAKLPEKVRIEIDALNSLSDKYMDSIILLSHDLATEALRLSKLTNYKKGEAKADINLGFYYFTRKIYLAAFE